jgi:arylformamidase
MILSLEINGKIYKIDLKNPLSIAIPLRFDGAQPNAYGVERASATACEAGAFVGDTRRGGSCNFEQVKLIPHCNGTHTESVGHITHERISIHECLRDVFVPAVLISVAPENAGETDETYSVELSANDKFITRRALESYKLQITNLNARALIVRTLPNDESKLSKVYLDEIPPFFSTEAIEFIKKIGINHLLADLPSIDRIFDEGKLSNHRIFWNVEPGSFEASEKTLIRNTITELIYAPDEIADGEYLLNLQIAPFAADAAPSRPVLFGIYE